MLNQQNCCDKLIKGFNISLFRRDKLDRVASLYKELPVLKKTKVLQTIFINYCISVYNLYKELWISKRTKVLHTFFVNCCISVYSLVTLVKANLHGTNFAHDYCMQLL